MLTPLPRHCKAPPLSQVYKEYLAIGDWFSVLGKITDLARVPKGDGRPVVLLPGYTGGHLSMSPLRAYLRYKNYNAHHWGLGRNDGHFEQYIEQAGEHISALADECGRPVTLIGYSLGGAIAREIARKRRFVIKEVITICSPLIGGPKYTALSERFAEQFGIDIEAFELEVHRRNSEGLVQPLTAIYSKSDRIVAWEAAMDVYNDHARNVQVQGSHFAMPVNANVWTIVGQTLAQRCRSASRKIDTQDRVHGNDRMIAA